MKQHMIAMLTALAALVSASTASAQSAENWPERSITIVVPSAPGGSTDLLTRALADGLSARLGQTVVVENRSGASGSIGLQAVARAPDDGYTYIMVFTSAVISAQYTFKELPFDVVRDFQTVAGIGFTELVMSVNADVPVKNPRELVNWMKQSGKPAYGSYGEGSYAHVASHYLGLLHGVDAVHAPYKGERPMLVAMASGDIAYGIGSFTAAKPVQDTGKIRMVGVLTPNRSPFYPDLPTFKEMGIEEPPFQMPGWFGLFARKSVPAAIIKKMEEAALAVVETPLMQQRMATLQLPVWGATAKEFEQTWFTEAPVRRDLLRLAGVEVYR